MPSNEIIHNAISELRNKWGFTCRQVLEGVLTIYGRSLFYPPAREMAYEKVNGIRTREKRKHYSPAHKQKLFDRQKGICPWCNQPLDIPASRNEVDHIRPDAEPFDAITNQQLCHGQCNREKSAMSITDQAKHTGHTIAEIIQPGIEDEP